MQSQKPVLQLENIVKVFPGVRALDGVKLDVIAGEVHALCGENGAGKSTLMKIISGAQPYTSGTMQVDGEAVVFHSTKDAEANGIAMIYQEFNLVPDLSVAENMYLGRLPAGRMGVNWKGLYDDAQKVLESLGQKFSSKTRVKNLSVAQAQMVEIAKCLTIQARVIIMDEPTAALTDEEISVLFDIIAQLKDRGISILYISHRMDEIFRISDRITVFRDGRHIATKPASETDYDDVVSMMVGKDVVELYPNRAYEPGPVVYELVGIEGKGVHGVSLSLHRGEILGIAGLLGSGNIELSKIVYGALPIRGGEIFIDGQLCNCSSPIRALRYGVGFVPDDRKGEGLVLVRSVRENITMASLKNILTGGCINKRKENEVVEREIDKLNIKVPSSAQLAGNLSGGNQQKVVFAKVLEANPSICILDEPTRGVDVGAKAEIYRIMDDLTKAGMSIILISSDLPELIGMSDRVLVMREGHVVKELSKEEASQEVVLTYASGGVA